MIHWRHLIGSCARRSAARSKSSSSSRWPGAIGHHWPIGDVDHVRLTTAVEVETVGVVGVVALEEEVRRIGDATHGHGHLIDADRQTISIRMSVIVRANEGATDPVRTALAAPDLILDQNPVLR